MSSSDIENISVLCCDRWPCIFFLLALLLALSSSYVSIRQLARRNSVFALLVLFSFTQGFATDLFLLVGPYYQFLSAIPLFVLMLVAFPPPLVSLFLE